MAVTPPAPGRTRGGAEAVALAALLVGWALRLVLLDRWPLREDEAIYSFWARSVTGDPFFLTVWPDKPPLFLWMQAAALHWFGPSAAGARLLSIGASTAMIALAWRAARAFWSPRAGAIAALLLALGPLAITFGPTAYTDSLLVFWGVAALALGARGRWWTAGVALGAAIFTKQQGLFYLPLMAALPFVVQPQVGGWRVWPRLAGGMALILLPVLVWDASRWATAPSPWDLGARNYGALALAAPQLWAERARQWGHLLWYLAASSGAWLLLAAAALWGAWSWRDVASRRGGRTLWLLLLWGVAFVALHWLSTVQPWDRYLLPLAPVTALLVAGLLAAVKVPRALGLWGIAAVVLGAALLLGGPALTAARGGYPVGADHGDYAGLDEAFAWLRGQAEEPNILYHNSVGWPAQFALFDEVAAGSTQLRWFPHAVYLADNAAKSPQRARYLLEPDWAPTQGLAPALAQRGLALEERLRAGRMSLYELVQEPQPACDWCLCRAPRWIELAPPANQRTVP